MQPKIKKYGSANGNTPGGVCLPVNHDDIPVSFGPLHGEKERKLFKALSKSTAQSTSILGQSVQICCKRIVQRKDKGMFNELVKTLKSQYRDNSSLMESIIGSEAVKLLMDLG